MTRILFSKEWGNEGLYKGLFYDPIPVNMSMKTGNDVWETI